MAPPIAETARERATRCNGLRPGYNRSLLRTPSLGPHVPPPRERRTRRKAPTDAQRNDVGNGDGRGPGVGRNGVGPRVRPLRRPRTGGEPERAGGAEADGRPKTEGGRLRRETQRETDGGVPG